MFRSTRVKVIGALAVVAAIAVAAYLFREPSQPAPETVAPRVKIKWHYSVWGPPRAFTSGIEYAKKVMEEAGGGDFEITIHYAGALAPPKEHLESIRIGLIEGAHVCVGYHPAKTPLAQVLELPFLLTENIEPNARIMDAVFRHPLIEEEFARGWNTKYLMLALLSRYEFMGNRRIATAADFAGVRVRISGGNSLLLKEFGGVPTMVTAPEAYTALDRGTVDVVGFPWTDSFGAFRLHEVSKYVTDGVAMSGFGCIAGVSLDAWNALPDKIQAVLPKIREQGIQVMIRAYEEGDKKWLPIFRERLEIVPFPKAEREKMLAKAEAIWNEWAAETDAKGLRGSEILQFALDQVAKYAAKQAK